MKKLAKNNEGQPKEEKLSVLVTNAELVILWRHVERLL